MEVMPLGAADSEWVASLVADRWGEPVITRGRVHWPHQLPGFAARRLGQVVGLVTYRIDGQQCEVISLDSLVEGIGVGTALLQAVVEVARQAGCRRVWLITTNDNLHALRFYQRRGWRLAALHRDALAESRRLKPSISLIGLDGIPIRDEIELEFRLDDLKVPSSP